MTVNEVVQHYGGSVTDRRDMAPDALHKLTRSGKSIDFVAGEYLPRVAGVSYGSDFLGTALPQGKTLFRSGEAVSQGLTIGAIQGVAQSEEPSEDPSEKPTTEPVDDPSQDPSEGEEITTTPDSSDTSREGLPTTGSGSVGVIALASLLLLGTGAALLRVRKNL